MRTYYVYVHIMLVTDLFADRLIVPTLLLIFIYLLFVYNECYSDSDHHCGGFYAL